MAKAKTKTSQFESFRAALQKKQQEMIASFSRERAAGGTQADDGIQDLADKAASAYSKELNYSLSDADRETLVQIEEALVRTESGEFGVCTNCSTQIGEKRLQAIPWSQFCIDCQELHEKGLL